MAISTTHGNVSHFMAGQEGTHSHEVLRAGALGGAVVWLWVFLIGALNGDPLRLAAFIGGGLTHIVGVRAAPAWAAVVVFTVLHFIAWLGLALASVVVIRVAVHTPAVLLLALVIGILVLLALAGVTTIFGSDGLGAAFAWPSIYAGSILGLGAMWWYLVHRHPEVRSELAHVNDD